MAGAGFDAAMIRDADDLKARIGRAAYLERIPQPAGGGVRRARSGSTAPTGTRGRATCILLGNVGDVFGGVEVFPDAGPTTACSSSASSRRRG